MDRKISTFQIILLSSFGAIGVAAVLIFALAVGGNSNGSVGKIVIWGTLDQTTFSTLLRKEADNDPRLAEVSYVQKDPADYEAQLADALASGTGPDIFIMSSDEAVADAGKTYEIPYTSLSASQFGNTFVSAATPYLATNGIVAIPILIDPLILYSNRDVLASAGVAQPPSYWDELPGIASSITQKSDDGSIQKSAIAMGTYKNIDSAKDLLSLLIMQAGGEITAKDTEGHEVAALAQSGNSSTAVQSALRFYTEFADPSQPDYTWSDALPNARQALGSGELAMYVGYASEAPLIMATNPNLNLGVSLIPQIRSMQSVTDNGRVYGLAISRHSTNIAGAQTVVFLLAQAQDEADISVAFGMPAARLDVLKASLPDSQSAAFTELGASLSATQIVVESALATKTWIDPDPTQTDPIFQAMIEDTESGASNIPDAIGKANEKLSALLGQQ